MKKQLCSLGCREDAVDGYIIKEKHDWFSIFQLPLCGKEMDRNVAGHHVLSFHTI